MTIITYKNRLLHAVVVGYISAAPHKTGAGILNPKESTKRTTARAVFLRAKHRHAFLFALWRGVQGRFRAGRVSLLTGVENPVRLATPEILNSGGELLNINKGATSWPTASNAALTRTVSTRKPKSNADSNASIVWHLICRLICYVCHTAQRRYGCRQSWTISQTISTIFRHCLTGQRTPRDLPENLTQKQHSACWWSVCLSDIQEAL